MKNIIWLASYPKSGNTLLRIFLSCYFFTENGTLDDFHIIKNITIFNNYNVFKKINGIDNKNEFIKNPAAISKYWIKAQKKLYELYPKKVFIFKTHNARVKHNNVFFTNEKFTRAFIYLVRDPRSVLVSAKNHYNYKNYEDSLESLLSDKHLSLAKYHVLPEFLLSWKTNYLSWKNFLKQNPNLGLIIKYEDLVQEPKNELLKIFQFIAKKHFIKFDQKKFDNALKSIKFKNLQSLENIQGFDERGENASKFFRKGLINEWKNEVPKNIINIIEKKYNKEMIDLGYL